MADDPPSNYNTTARKRGSDETQGGAPPPKQSSREPMTQQLYVDLSYERQNVLQPKQRAPLNEMPKLERLYNGLTTALGVPECGICRDELVEPRTLHCGHNICANCEPRLVDYNRNLLCPMCRKATTVPAEGLPMNFELAEIVKALKEANAAGSGLAVTDSADTPFGYRLFCGPKPLNDGKIKVSQTNVQKHGTIHVLYRARAG